MALTSFRARAGTIAVTLGAPTGMKGTMNDRASSPRIEHVPGIQPADVEELLEHGARVVVLSRGMDERLRVQDRTLARLEEAGAEVHVAETREAVRLYNRLRDEGRAVGGLFHSTC